MSELYHGEAASPIDDYSTRFEAVQTIHLTFQLNTFEHQRIDLKLSSKQL